MKTLTTKQRLKKMIYLILPAVAGLAIALQTAFSGKLNQQFGAIETVIIIHLFGLLLAIAVYLLRGHASFSFMSNINILAVIAGSLGVIIVFSISKSFNVNGALTTIMISVIIQLIVSKIIDHYGLFGIEKNPVNMVQIYALIIIISGVVLLQYNK